MSTYNISSGQIQTGVLYQIFGSSGTVTYNGNTYVANSSFRGITGFSTFTFTGDAVVQEVLELIGSDVELLENSIDFPSYPDDSALNGMAVEFALDTGEYVVNEKTRIQGFALELIDYPFYSFEITETRL